MLMGHTDAWPRRQGDTDDSGTTVKVNGEWENNCGCVDNESVPQDALILEAQATRAFPEGSGPVGFAGPILREEFPVNR
jgi:hypothetical protein